MHPSQRHGQRRLSRSVRANEHNRDRPMASHSHKRDTSCGQAAGRVNAAHNRTILRTLGANP